MTASSYDQGHKIKFDPKINKWVWYDNGQAINDKPRPCVRCDKMAVNGHDACIVNLPGVKNACCGHGIESGYIQFENGKVLDLKS